MPDLTKHKQSIKKAIQSRNYDLAIEQALQCQEVDPVDVEVYQLVIDAAKRRAKEGGKKGFGGLGFGSKDPHKALTTAVKKLSRSPEVKEFIACGDAARNVQDAGVKGMASVAVLFYEEGRATGLFDKKLLWNAAQTYHDLFKQSKDVDWLNKAIETVAELDAGDPHHPEAKRTLKNWEAEKSINVRSVAKGDGGKEDFSNQLSGDREARRNEVMNRIIRTKEDAMEVVAFIDEDLVDDPENKQLWMKKGDIYRRIKSYADARQSYERAAEIDSHDFLLVIRVGDLLIEEKRDAIRAAAQAGQDVKAAKAELVELEIKEYRIRSERQPTEMSHRYNLGSRLFSQGLIDEAAGELQRAVTDPRYKQKSFKYLGHCFVKKKLYDMAIEQFSNYIDMVEDPHEPEAKEMVYNRARLLEQTGKTDAAIADYRKLVEIDLGFKDAAERMSVLKGNS